MSTDTARLVLLALAMMGAVACSSPEATRSRGGGPGGDVGNHGAVVQMHEGARPFYGTPLKGAGR